MERTLPLLHLCSPPPPLLDVLYFILIRVFVVLWFLFLGNPALVFDLLEIPTIGDSRFQQPLDKLLHLVQARPLVFSLALFVFIQAWTLECGILGIEKTREADGFLVLFLVPSSPFRPASSFWPCRSHVGHQRKWGIRAPPSHER
jgi:hypothetical protein